MPSGIAQDKPVVGAWTKPNLGVAGKWTYLYRAVNSTGATRTDRPLPAQYAGPEAEERIAALKAVSGETGATLNQVIIAWMRHSDPPVLPIIAGSRPEQVQENLAALEVTLSPDQMRHLDAAGNPDIERAWLR